VLFSVDEIISITHGRLIKGCPHQIVNQISTDSRNLVVGDLFMALIGERFDGHHFLSQALSNGAMGIIISRPHISLEGLKIPLVIQVPDTLKAYGDLARAYRKKFDGSVVAVTGSNGKTTTKEMIASVLSVKFRLFKSKGNYNNLIGLPKCLLELPIEQIDIAVFELGTNRPGEITRLAEIVQPTVGLITNIGFSHIEFLGNLDGVAREKCSLLKNVEVAILNSEDEKLTNVQTNLTTNRINFGTNGDVAAQDIRLDPNGLVSFQLVINQLGQSIPINLSCVGRHNVSNALAAAAVGWWAGLTIEQTKIGLENFQAVEMRLQPITINGCSVINDTYNANPNSMQSALAFFANLPSRGKKIIVLGDMLELGIQSDNWHFRVGENIPIVFDLLITIGQLSQQMAKGAKNRVPQIISCGSAKEAIIILDQYLSDGDALLIKGSRGLNLEQIVESLQNRESKELVL